MYNNFLLKIGSYTFPMKHIAENSYAAIPHQRQDSDPWRSEDGDLNREVVKKRPSVVRFSTVAGLTNAEVRTIFEQIHGQYINEDERKVLVTFYDPEYDDYADPEEMYIPNLEFPIDYIDGTTVVYDSIRFEFIGY